MKKLILTLLLAFAPLTQAVQFDDSTTNDTRVDGAGDTSLYQAQSGRTLLSDYPQIYNGAATTSGMTAYRVVWPNLHGKVYNQGWKNIGNISSGSVSTTYAGHNCASFKYSLSKDGLIIYSYSGGTGFTPCSVKEQVLAPWTE